MGGYSLQVIIGMLTNHAVLQVSTRAINPVATTLGLMCGDGHFGILAEGDEHIAGMPTYDWIINTIQSVTEPDFLSDVINERLFVALHDAPMSRVCITLAGFRRYQRVSQRVLTRISNLERHDEGRLRVQTFAKPSEDPSQVILSGDEAHLSERQWTALSFIERRKDIVEDMESLSSKLLELVGWGRFSDLGSNRIVMQSIKYGRERFSGRVLQGDKPSESLPLQVIHRRIVVSQQARTS